MKKRIVCTTLLIETSPQALPLGAACIASSLKNDEEINKLYDIDLISVSREEKDFSTENAGTFIAERIEEKGEPSIVFFSVYVWNRKELESASLILKQRFPGLITVAGGPEVTASPLSFSSFDYTISGAGEWSAVRLLHNLISGKTEKLSGVFNLKNTAEESGCPLSRSQPPELEKLSSPYLDGTLNVSEYGGALWELARGCPFKCSYCYESKGEKKIKYFPMERIEKELELFNSKKISQVFVLDPTYNASKKRALELLNLIEKKAPGMFFYFEARAEFIDRELAKAFTRIPCALQFGLQSADPEVLKLVNRTLDKKLFTKNIGYLNDEGAVFGFDLIYGLPGDTFEGFKKSIDFALNLYPNNLETFCLSVLPGTDLYESAEKLGLTWMKEPPYNVIKTTKISEKEMVQAKRLSIACSYFYNEGRAVPWFNTIVRALHRRPSAFLEDFGKFLEETKTDTAECRNENVEKTIIKYTEKVFGKTNLLSSAVDLIKFNSALSRVESDGKEQLVSLEYHPDDLASEYATDLQFFAKNAQKFRNRTKCFRNKSGLIDWKTVK